MHRYGLTDARSTPIERFFPDRRRRGRAGRPWKGPRPPVDGIPWHLHTGTPRPDVPERYGPWQTVYDRFNRRRKDGAWAGILDALLLRPDEDGFIDRDPWCDDPPSSAPAGWRVGRKKIPTGRRNSPGLRRRK